MIDRIQKQEHCRNCGSWDDEKIDCNRWRSNGDGSRSIEPYGDGEDCWHPKGTLYVWNIKKEKK